MLAIDHSKGLIEILVPCHGKGGGGGMGDAVVQKNKVGKDGGGEGGALGGIGGSEGGSSGHAISSRGSTREFN